MAYRGLGTGLAYAPSALGEAGAAIATDLVWRFGRTDRRYAERNMARVLASGSPKVTPDPALVRRWTRRTFRAYGHYWAEGARLPQMTPAEVRSAMVVEQGYDHLVGGMASGRGVVMALPHVGSWEWGGAFLASEGYPMTSVAERLEPPALYDWFVSQRAAMGLTIVPLDKDASGTLLRTLRAGGLVGLLCDRDIGGNGVEVELFGERTTLPAGPATMALRTGAVLVAAAVYSGPGRFHTGVVSAPIPAERTGRLRSDVARVTQAIATELEGYIRRAPEQWHLFQPNWPSDAQVASSAPPRRGA